MKEIIIYTDGSALKNPKGGYFGGAGAVLIYGKRELELSESIPEGTNNISELQAAIIGLRTLTEPCKVTLYTDSKYVINCITQWIPKWKYNNWKSSTGKDVKNKELILVLDGLCVTHEVDFVWVKGHNDDYYNELADRLAVEASTELKERVLNGL